MGAPITALTCVTYDTEHVNNKDLCKSRLNQGGTASFKALEYFEVISEYPRAFLLPISAKAYKQSRSDYLYK